MLRIKLRYDDAESMVQRFAPNVGKSGLFLPTKSLQPLGAEVKFELRLANDTPVLLGLGKVKAIKEPDPANPKASFGMAIELMRVTRESRDLILRMLERRKQLGLPEIAIPMAADLDAARQTADTGVRAAPARDSRPAIDSGPVAVPKDAVTRESEPVLAAGVVRESGPIARDSQSESLLTAPRRATGPIAVVKVSSIAPLAPEPARRRRPAIAEVIEAASGPIATTVVGLPDDIDVDVNAVIARARVLAGGDLDGELEALLDLAAAPVEVGIEAASAELARQLGGVAVRRGQSGPAGWAPPPKIEEAKPVVPEPVVAATPEPVVGQTPEPVVEAKAPIAPEPADTYADPAAATAALDDVQTPVTPHEMLTDPGLEPVRDLDEPAHEVEPDQIHDEIHQLGAGDYEEVEHTHVGQVIPGFDQHAFATVPSVEDHAMAERLDRHLADVEAAHEDDDLGIREASGLHDLSAPEPVIELKSARLPKAEIYDDGDDGDDGPDDELDDEEDEPDEAAAAPPPAKPALPVEYQQDFIHRFDDQAADQEPAPATVAAYDASAYQALIAHQERSGFAEPAEPAAYAEQAAYPDQPAYAEQAAYPDQPAYAEQAAYPDQPAYAEQAAYPDQPAYADAGTPGVDAYGHTVDAAIAGYAAPPPEENLEDVEEIDDFEILAEADEEDADLLSSHGEADASGQVAIPHELRASSQHGSAPHERASSQPIPVAAPAHQSGRHIVPGRSSPHVVRRGSQHSQQQPIVQPVAPAPEPKPRDSDFAMRLDFGDDEEPYPQAAQAVPAPLGLDASAGHALAGFENDEDSHHNFTLAEQPRPEDLDGPHFGFSPPDRFDQSDVVPIAPSPRSDWNDSERNQWIQVPAGDEVDLESALQALDVDLDDLAHPHASTEVPGRAAPRRAQIRPPSSAQIPEPSQQRASSRGGRRPPRASSDDGVLIDFDDDEE